MQKSTRNISKTKKAAYDSPNRASNKLEGPHELSQLRTVQNLQKSKLTQSEDGFDNFNFIGSK